MTETVRRKKAANENDKRILKTRQSIRNALFHLIEKESIDKITVTQIVNEANINRSTFYFYYRDIDDMISSIQEEVYDAFKRGIMVPDSQFTTPDHFRKYICKFLTFCKENYEICKFVTSNGCNNELFARIRCEVEQVIPNSQDVYPSTDSRYYLTTFAVSGILYSILEWFNDGMKIEPDEMAEFLASVYIFGSLKTKVTTNLSIVRH